MSDTTQPFRAAAGGLIDRSRALRFTFDSRTYHGHPGDTLASALIANGVRLIARSFKYHRPRGVLTAGSEEPNALVELGGGARREPNTRATMIELYAGLYAVSQNRWPTLGLDLLEINALLSPFLPAGFYYKTFMWPPSFWEKVYEPAIRRAAGLGRASTEPDPDHYERATAFCDLLVIGAGPAGLAAALTAARAGARVVLCDEGFRLGGSLLAERRPLGEQSAESWASTAEEELRALPEVRILARTTAFGVYDHGVYGAVERVSDHLPEPPMFAPRQRLWRIVAKHCVLAAGAIERPLVFGNNDRPGVMLAGAARAYVNRYAALPGRNAVVFANNDGATAAIDDLAAAGITVAAVIDARPDGSPALAEAAQRAGARHLGGAVVTRALGWRGVRAVEVREETGASSKIECDLLLVSGGFDPAVHLTSHLGGKPIWSSQMCAFVPGDLPAGMTVAGAASGEFDLAGCLASGARLGREAAQKLGFTAQPLDLPDIAPEATGIAPLWRVRGVKKAFVDFQNDVTADDIELAAREGFRAIEHLKRYTTLGMATDQGKTANVNAIAAMAEITAADMTAIGTTTFRPPYTPVAIGALAGHGRGPDFRPTRLTPSHDWAGEHGAVFVETGEWLRAQYFPRAGEADWLATVSREVRATREGVGFCDVSTLGKIDLQGPDAVEFLQRIYMNDCAALAVGRARYGVMLREDGFVLDDGTIARLADQHFLITTTTAHAGRIYQHLEFARQCLWPELDVQLASVTDQWAQFSVAGPHARELLRRVVHPTVDLSNEAFPYLAAGEIRLRGGEKARLFRISFSGELAYEIAVPAGRGDALVRTMMAIADLDPVPYGTEALSVMRIEKGHVAGNEISGQTTARDLGLGRMMSRRKDYIGRTLAERPVLNDPGRPTLVGLRPVDHGERLRAGAHFLSRQAAPRVENDEGYMTSVAFSPVLGHWIGLGLLKYGPERMGEIVRAYDPVRGGDVLVEVVAPVFWDPEGARLRD